MSDLKSPCVIPWMHRYNNEQGLQMLCCVGDGEANVLRDERGLPIHVNDRLTNEQLLNSPDLKAIRQGMVQGQWPAACVRCSRDEEVGAASQRFYMNELFGQYLPSALADTAPDGTLAHPQVRYADIRLGNVCNLTCRMCGPSASRLWTDHYNAVQPRGYLIPASDLTRLRSKNWVKDDTALWLIEQCLPAIDSLHFAGGEPLIIPEMVQLLELCIRSGRAHEISLSYNANLTVLPEKVTSLWPHFKSVLITASIDGYGTLNDYIRRPSRWATIDANLHVLDENFSQWKLRAVACNITVQVYNVLQLGELYDYLTSDFKNIEPMPRLSPLYTPAYLSIQTLPTRVKDAVREKIQALQKKVESKVRRTDRAKAQYLQSIIDFMDAAQVDGKLGEFLYFSEKSDREFGDSWRNACPELAAQLLRPSAPTPA